MKITKLGNQWQWDDYINGKRIKRTKKTWKYKYQAQEDYDRYIGEHGQATHHDITFKTLFDKYIEFSSLKNKQSHIRGLKYSMNRHALSLFDMKVKDITPNTIVEWQKTLMNTKTKQGAYLSNSYTSSLQSTVRRVFQFGIDHQLINHNPAVTMITAEKKEPIIVEDKRILTLDEFNKFVEKVDKLEYQAFFNTLYWCGLRMGEAIALTFHDYKDGRLFVSKNYDYANQVITTTKTSVSRYVDVPIRCKLVLDELLEYYKKFDYDESSSLFGLYKWLSPTTIRRERDKALKASGVKHFAIHDLRHSHVSTLIDLGFSAFEISKRLGHSVDMVNNTYGHLFPSRQKAMIDKLNSL